MKLYIAPSAVPVAKYFGFFAARMTPFFKNTGGNEVEVMVNSERSVKCWSWGSYNGAGWALKHGDVSLPFFGNGKYESLHQYKGLNMVICEIGVTAGTTGTGDVIIIPATQSAVDNPATVNNPLPGFLTSSTTLYESTKTNLLLATNSGASGSNPAIIAGSDEYLGTMTHISNGNVNFNTRINTADYEGKASGGNLADNSVPYFWSNGNKLNDNTNGLFDIVSKATASTTWLIGGTKIDSIMKFKMAAAAAWSNDRAVAAVCGPTAGSTIPSSTVMSSGTTGTSHACTAAFTWTPFAADFNTVTGYDTKT